MYEGPFYLQFDDDSKIRQKEERFQQSLQKLLKRYPNMQANFDNLEQASKSNELVKKILSYNWGPYDMMKAGDDLCKQKQFIQALQVYDEGLKVSGSLIERCFLQKSRDYCIKSWAKHLFKNRQYLEAIKKFDEFSETWHGSSSFDERYEVLRWKYSALFHLKVDVWACEALINPFAKFFHHLETKMTACFSCHKKMHDNSTQLITNLEHEDVGEYKWTDSSEKEGKISTIGQDHNETIVN